MKTGKEIMLEYCKTIKTHSIDHLQDCKDIEIGLTKYDSHRYDNYLDGHCPSSFGLDNYEGQCYINELSSPIKYTDEQCEQCKLCWKIAEKEEFN